MKNKEIEKKYKKLLKDIETDDFYKKINLTYRVNCYVCGVCGHITKTIDVDPGVTPFMHNCEKCGQIAHSTFYTDIAPEQEYTEEWYRLSLDEVLQMQNEGLIEHILRGGLNVRRVPQKRQSKEEILPKHFRFEFGHDGHGKFMKYILNAMEEYAQQKINEQSISTNERRIDPIKQKHVAVISYDSWDLINWLKEKEIYASKFVKSGQYMNDDIICHRISEKCDSKGIVFDEVYETEKSILNPDYKELKFSVMASLKSK